MVVKLFRALEFSSLDCNELDELPFDFMLPKKNKFKFDLQRDSWPHRSGLREV